jgi:hypothetical protein
MVRVSHPDTTSGFNAGLYVLMIDILLTVVELRTFR